MNIKKLSFLIIVFVLGFMFLAQMFTLINFKLWGDKQTEALFENTVSDVTKRINDEVEIVEEIAFNVVIDKAVQERVYPTKEGEKAENVQAVFEKLGIYGLNTKNIDYIGIIAGNEVLNYRLLDEIAGGNLYQTIEKIIQDKKVKEEKNTFVGNYIMENTVYFAYLSEIFPLDVFVEKKEDCYVLILFEPSGILTKNINGDETITKAAIVDENNVMLVSNYGLKVGEKYREVKEKGIITKMAEVEKIRCRLHVTMPSYEVLDVSQPLNALFVIVAIFMVVLFIFLMLTLINNILRDILDIEKGAKIITNSDYSYRFKAKKTNEITNIAIAINGILDAVDKSSTEKLDMQEKLYQAKLLQQQTQISHMQNQISPHFLYNSMEQINSIAKQKDIPELVAITNIMADTFRYNADGDEYTTIGEDIDYAFNYFNVINLRRSSLICVTYDVPDDVLKCKCIKMIFQPILENTIKHAFSRTESGNVELTGHFEEDYVIIEFKDDGKGIDEDKLKNIKRSLDSEEFLKTDKSGSIGLLNVHKRLRIHFDDEECGLSVKSKVGVGTIISVKMKKLNKI